MKSVLSVAGSDSGGGAGIQQDLKVFSSLGLHGATALTAVTAQNTLGVQKVFALPLDVVEAQIDSVMSDLKPAAVKTGMLSSAETIKLVRRKMQEYGVENLVVDPVMVSTSGDRLMDDDAVDEMRKLVSDATVSTPNIEEAQILAGLEITTEEDMESAAERLGCSVVKGGHLRGVDVLFFEGDFYRFLPKELKNVKLHGTGCAFSSAVAAYLAKDECIPDAVGHAKEYIDSVIARNYSPGSGLRVIDTGNVKLSVSYDDPKKASVAANLEDAIHLFCSSPHSYKLMPEVGINIAMALEDAENIQDVAGISGRIVKDTKWGRTAVPVGVVVFGGSSHVGRIILTARGFDSRIRAALNIRFGEDTLSACEKLSLRVSSFDREKQPPDTPTMEWGTSEAIKKAGRVPDAICDRGAVGKEAMIRLLGEDAKAVVEVALEIAEKLP